MGEDSYYVKNKDLLNEIIKYKATFKIDDEGNLISRNWKNVRHIGSNDS